MLNLDTFLLRVLAAESEARETRLLSNGLRPGRPLASANRLGQAARPARRRGDREQEVVELKFKSACAG